MPARGTGKRIQAKGLFANASVSRGHDWIWGDQDGGLLAHLSHACCNPFFKRWGRQCGETGGSQRLGARHLCEYRSIMML